MLGELNASHTGGRFYPDSKNGDHSASLGLLYDQDYAGPGIKVTEVISGGPLDKAKSRIAAGDIILKINGQEIASG